MEFSIEELLSMFWALEKRIDERFEFFQGTFRAGFFGEIEMSLVTEDISALRKVEERIKNYGGVAIYES